MTPKEKASELVGKFAMVNAESIVDEDGLWDMDFALTDDDAVKCAIIAVNEIIGLGFLTNGNDHERIQESQIYYWKEVITEIEKL